jgi:hypothetical protein
VDVARNELFRPPDLVIGKIFLVNCSDEPHTIEAALVNIAVQIMLVVIIPLARISCARNVKHEHVISTALQQPSASLQVPPRQTKEAKQHSDEPNLTIAISPALHTWVQQLLAGLRTVPVQQ